MFVTSILRQTSESDSWRKRYGHMINDLEEWLSKQRNNLHFRIHHLVMKSKIKYLPFDFCVHFFMTLWVLAFLRGMRKSCRKSCMNSQGKMVIENLDKFP